MKNKKIINKDEININNLCCGFIEENNILYYFNNINNVIKELSEKTKNDWLFVYFMDKDKNEFITDQTLYEKYENIIKKCSILKAPEEFDVLKSFAKNEGVDIKFLS